MERNQETDTKPEPGSYEEFHATVLNQIETFLRAHPILIMNLDTQQVLAQDIAGNLWQGFLQERDGLITALVTDAAALVDAMHRYEMDVEGNAPPEHLRMMERAHDTLDRATAAGYEKAVQS